MQDGHGPRLETFNDNQPALRVDELKSCQQVEAAVPHLVLGKFVRRQGLQDVRVGALKVQHLRVGRAHPVLDGMKHLVVGVVHDEHGPNVRPQGLGRF